MAEEAKWEMVKHCQYSYAILSPLSFYNSWEDFFFPFSPSKIDASTPFLNEKIVSRDNFRWKYIFFYT